MHSLFVPKARMVDRQNSRFPLTLRPGSGCILNRLDYKARIPWGIALPSRMQLLETPVLPRPSTTQHVFYSQFSS